MKIHIYVLTWGLLFTALTTNGQVTTPQIPTFQNNFPQVPQPWSPNNNNNPFGAQQQRNQQLEDLYEESMEEMYNVNFSLPPCPNTKGIEAYHSAFTEITTMASGQKKFNIKEANFLVENAYFENTRNFQNFDKMIKQIGQFLNLKMDELSYNKNSNLAKNLILFRFFTDTLEIKSKNLKHFPIKYDFEDYRGKIDWSNMFVEKVLATNSGQCHSLPLLYLILADEIGAKAQLSYSPNHTYIKFQDDNGKWHNVELTNGMMTTDAFVLQSGYIKAEALQNKIYMQPLSENQLLSHVLFDLAKGYSKKYCYDEFVEKVISKALELDSNNIHAHMVLADYRTIQFKHIENQLGITQQNYRQILSQYPIAKEIYKARNRQYKKVDNLGYEEMPAAEYEKWLNSMNDAKQKQQSQDMYQNLNKTIQNKAGEIKK